MKSNTLEAEQLAYENKLMDRVNVEKAIIEMLKNKDILNDQKFLEIFFNTSMNTFPDGDDILEGIY